MSLLRQSQSAYCELYGKAQTNDGIKTTNCFAEMTGSKT